jgi:hypothetical protein
MLTLKLYVSISIPYFIADRILCRVYPLVDNGEISNYNKVSDRKQIRNTATIRYNNNGNSNRGQLNKLMQ